MPSAISSPDSAALQSLCAKLAELAQNTDVSGQWPAEQLQLCGEYGVYQWFLDPQWGGQAWPEIDIVKGYLALSSACLTTTFIITQRSGACRRIAGSENQELKELLLPPLACGETFATVGISHLTTSRRHLAKPVLQAREFDSGFVLDGFSPWVTGAAHAEHVVVGATLMDGDEASDKQLLVALPVESPGVTVPPPLDLVGVSASHTGQVKFDQVHVDRCWLLAGPMPEVMASGQGAGTGGHQTSTLALGLSNAAIEFIAEEASRRDELREPLDALRQEYQEIYDDLMSTARGNPACSNEQLRQRVNSLVLRAAQASLAAAKGTGYMVGHPAGRWCREALFFLVWSCPQPVLAAHLCELAGLVE